MIHALKTLKPYFDALTQGVKTYEVRKNDRDFNVGDFLALNEIAEIEKKYTGRCCMVAVTHILTDPEYVKPGYAILSVEPCAIARRSASLVYTNRNPNEVDVYGPDRNGVRNAERK